MYWGGNPAECHPRHFTKYTIMQKSKFLPRGRKDRTMVLVDIRETKSAKAADIFLQVKPGKDFELITILRALIKDQHVGDEQISQTGMTRETLDDLVQRMKSCKFGCFFFGMGLSMTRGKHMNSAALLTLAAEMNAFTKFVAMPMRGHGNVTGADVVMRWQTGYPFGITFNRGYPRYNPGEFSTVDVLVRGDCDAAFIIGADPGATMPQPAIDHLKTHTDNLSGSAYYSYQQTGASTHHNSSSGNCGSRDGLSNGRNSTAAKAGLEVAISHGRRSRSPN